MTKLIYKVGDEEISTYLEAQRRSAETGLPAVPTYVLKVEEQKTDSERLAKMQEYFARLKAEKKAKAE